MSKRFQPGILAGAASVPRACLGLATVAAEPRQPSGWVGRKTSLWVTVGSTF